MRDITVSIAQTILNKCNSKKEFTYFLNWDHGGDYVVSIRNLYTGKNPSLDNDLLRKINKALADELRFKSFDSIGLWIDENKNICIDANIHVKNKKTALSIAADYNQTAIYDLKNKQNIFL